jgi:chromosome segregation ATPase
MDCADEIERLNDALDLKQRKLESCHDENVKLRESAEFEFNKNSELIAACIEETVRADTERARAEKAEAALAELRERDVAATARIAGLLTEVERLREHLDEAIQSATEFESMYDSMKAHAAAETARADRLATENARIKSWAETTIEEYGTRLDRLAGVVERVRGICMRCRNPDSKVLLANLPAAEAPCYLRSWPGCGESSECEECEECDETDRALSATPDESEER